MPSAVAATIRWTPSIRRYGTILIGYEPIATRRCDMIVRAHARQRLAERLSAAEQQQAISHAAQIAPSVRKGDGVAAVLLRLEKRRNNGKRSVSNGDMVVGIIRDGELITIMMRRASQVLDAATLRVQQVVDATLAA
jgi:hypothetical protein